jgi:hypothetical protein
VGTGSPVDDFFENARNGEVVFGRGDQKAVRLSDSVFEFLDPFGRALFEVLLKAGIPLRSKVRRLAPSGISSAAFLKSARL